MSCSERTQRNASVEAQTRNASDEAQTRNPSISSQALYHRAPCNMLVFSISDCEKKQQLAFLTSFKSNTKTVNNNRLKLQINVMPHVYTSQQQMKLVKLGVQDLLQRCDKIC